MRVESGDESKDKDKKKKPQGFTPVALTFKAASGI
jgi:hypothetical protein